MVLVLALAVARGELRPARAGVLPGAVGGGSNDCEKGEVEDCGEAPCGREGEAVKGGVGGGS